MTRRNEAMTRASEQERLRELLSRLPEGITTSGQRALVHIERNDTREHIGSCPRSKEPLVEAIVEVFNAAPALLDRTHPRAPSQPSELKAACAFLDDGWPVRLTSSPPVVPHEPHAGWSGESMTMPVVRTDTLSSCILATAKALGWQPKPREQETFEQAVRTSGLTVEQQERLLSTPDAPMPVEKALARAREYLDHTKPLLSFPGGEEINGWVHRERLVALVRACEAAPSLSRAQGMRIAEAVRFAGLEQMHSPPSDADLTAIVSRILGEPSAVEKAERRYLDAKYAYEEWPRTEAAADEFDAAYVALRTARAATR